jgi:hypothetical protein
MSRVALVVIATGERYHQFVEPFLVSARQFFVPHTPILFSDNRKLNPYKVIQHEGFPGATLHRYRTITQAQSYLSSFDHIWYADIDMRFVAPVDADILVDAGLVATLHPGFVGTEGTPERRKESRAYIESGGDNDYFCGGFNGGSAAAYLNMAAELAADIEEDETNGITPIWHDESMLNRYLFDHPPAKILSPSYCSVEGSPDPRYPPILVALSKGWCRTCGVATKPHVNDCGRHRA